MSKTLFEILSRDVLGQLDEKHNLPVKELCFDSRKVTQGSLYFALRGTHADGHDYIGQAVANGAIAVICEEANSGIKNVPQIVVQNSRSVMALAASLFYDQPSKKLKVVGVTGTNGKTSVTTMAFQLFKKLGFKVGLISTVKVHIDDITIDSTHTTPDVITINDYLNQMVIAGCSYVFMEVSSHALDQQRTNEVDFAGAVFTNISHDHLDYHKDFKTYIWTKKKLFDNLNAHAFALVNIDDKRGEVMTQNSKASKRSFALKQMADYKGKILSNAISGLHMTVNGIEAVFPMIGAFNAYNILAVFGIARELGFDAVEILTKLSEVRGAEGRFELVYADDKSKMGVVDYAHTPDALENVLETLGRIVPRGSKIITVAGCGGDRDGLKRPLMAKVIAKWSDQYIFTSDNPRSEDPEAILDDMVTGLEKDEHKNMLRIADRRQAIRSACMIAQKGDVILVAGKGHEKYQEIKGEKYPFDDKKVLLEALSQST